MGKKSKKASGKKRAADASGTTAWSSADHAVRKARKERKLGDNAEKREKRTAALTRDSKEKHEAGKLRLQIKKVKRELDVQRERLEQWDDVEESLRMKRQRQAEEEARRKKTEEESGPKKRKGRKGPETWKLRGAARPAWEVYDFDTRYVDPHIKALEEANAKRQRQRNIIALGKGRFGADSNDDIPQPACRRFLALLMQYGLLNKQAKNLRSARQAFLECMELDSLDQPITPARCHLIRLYMDANRPDSARRLWEKLPSDDPSVWIRYSAALVEFVSWKILQEEDSTRESAEDILAHAVRANVFCAYYLSFSKTFEGVMDYVEDIEEAHEGHPLEEAIEYCNSEQMGAWYGTEDALEWIRSVIVKAVKGESPVLSVEDVNWRGKLQEVRNEARIADRVGTDATDETEPQERTSSEVGSQNGEDDDDDDDDENVDVAMFAGMFETAMEMVEEEGGIPRVAT